MRYNRELQNIDTPDKAYLLGLFYADGNVSKNQHHSKLYLKDKELIVDVKRRFDFFNYYETDTLFGVHSGINKVREDFISNGCLPDKSVSNKSLLKIPFINELTFHFIRGYFDGDGGCTLTSSGGKTQKRVYLYSASLGFLEEVKDFLRIFYIDSTIIKSSSIYKLQIRTNSYFKFYTNLYANTDFYLLRKFEKFTEIFNTNFLNQREAPNCKFCKSENTVFNGNYTYKSVVKPRVLCKDCKRNFTLKTAPHSSNIMSGGDELLES